MEDDDAGKLVCRRGGGRVSIFPTARAGRMNLSGADLRECSLENAAAVAGDSAAGTNDGGDNAPLCLMNADLRAILSQVCGAAVHFEGANLERAMLTSAVLERASFEETPDDGRAVPVSDTARR